MQIRILPLKNSGSESETKILYLGTDPSLMSLRSEVEPAMRDTMGEGVPDLLDNSVSSKEKNRVNSRCLDLLKTCDAYIFKKHFYVKMGS